MKYNIYANNIVNTLSKLTINGIKDIEQINYTQKPGDEHWFIEAMGFNLKKLLANDIIDDTRTVSNHMWELYETLGIEAD